MGTLRLFNFYRDSLIKNKLLQISRTVEQIHVARYCSPVIDSERSYELGNFHDDLKPYLKSKKSRERPHLTQKRKKDELVIKCKNHKINHYRNQVYDKFKPVPLASEKWRSYKSVGDYFTINIYPKNYVETNQITTTTFEGSDMNPKIVDMLKNHGVVTMSEIQERAIPQILSGKNCLLAAETGCGKTLAYVLPIVEQILQWKNDKTDKTSEYNAPLVLIVTPSRELTDQIRDVIKWFQPLGITCLRTVGGHMKKRMQNPPVNEIDVLVSTIGIIKKLTSADIYSLENVRHVILDEADALLDDSFNQLTIQFLKRFQIRSIASEIADKGVQLTLVSATMPTSIPDILGDVVEVDRIQKVTTPYLHHALPYVIQKFYRVSRSNKPSYLLQIAKKEYHKKAPLIIFCNTSETCHWVSTFLNESGVSNVSLHGDVVLKFRKGRFEMFQNGEETVLVCTSLASRGLDTKQVQHVLNFDFPLFIADYIHRCGRTGRLGSHIKGRVTNLISGKNEIELVQKIEKAVRTGTEFENVNANIKRIMEFHRTSDSEKSPDDVE